tara:strand:- start:4306 stop:4674 length:369 start_codon:yes stop_codon:yes gene_type:complete
MFEGPKSIISSIVGVILIVLGGVPVLNTFGIISFSLPVIPEVVMLIILAVAGAYLFIDGIFQFALSPAMAWTSMALGIIFGGAGTLRILNIMSSVVGIVQGTVINVIFLIIGILLMIGAFMF